ncbi:MAG TPA: ferritin-like domain-containing protein [Trebonia sp.]
MTINDAPAVSDAHSFDVFQHYERLHWRLSDLGLDAITRDLARPEYVSLVRGVVVGEATALPGQHGFLNEFGDDYDCSAFIVVWGYQELQHHYAFRAWLRAVDIHIGQAKIEALREPYEPGATPSATLATNAISELIVNTLYRKMSQWVEEPVLSRLFLLASRDEAGHAREFLYYMKRRLQQHPEEMGSVLERIHFYVNTSAQLKHPVGEYKHERLEEYRDHERASTVADKFLEVSEPDALDQLQAKIRRALGSALNMDFSRNVDIRRALAEAAAPPRTSGR